MRLIAGILLLLAIHSNHGLGAVVSASDLDRAIKDLLTYTWSETRESLNPIETAIQQSTGNPAVRKDLENRLVSVLKSRAPFPAKQYACRKMSQIATADSVPALAQLLRDPALSHSVRLVLERIPDPSAATALRDALRQSAYAARLGIINSLGVLRDTNSVPLLQPLLKDSEATVVSATLAALGHIGTIESVEVLESFREQEDNPLRVAAAEALIVAAGHLTAEGQPARATAIFRRLYNPDEPAAIRSAAFRGLVLSQPGEAFRILSEALAGDNPLERGVAARLLLDAQAIPALSRFAEIDYPPAGQLALLEAFRSRQDLHGRLLALKLLQSDDPQTRLTAIEAMAALGKAEDVSLLAPLAATPRGQQTAAARAALANLADPAASAVMIDALAKSPPPVAVELIHALAARAAFEAGPAVAAQLGGSDETGRAAALQALAVIGTGSQMQAVIQALAASPGSEQREAAQGALVAIVRRGGDACARELLEASPHAQPESRILLLQALGIAGGPAALAATRAALADGDPAIRDASFRVLANWSTADAGPDLLGLSQSATNATWRTLAFRGFIRLARESEAPPDARLQMLRDAMKSARNGGENRLVIAALGELRHRGSLSLLLSCLEQPELAEEACAAIVNIAADPAAADDPGLVPALRRVLRVSTSQQVRQKAEAVLAKLEPR